MSEDGFLQQYSREHILIASGLISAGIGFLLGYVVFSTFGSGVGEQLSFVDTPPLPSGDAIGNFTASAFDADPGHTFRLIQAVGILLPLFTGLLRLTTDDQSDVGEHVNRYLFLGILGLVVGGVVAAIGGMATETAGVLKVALFFVLVTFAVIGLAAMVMFGEIPGPTADTDDGTPGPKPDGTDSEDSPREKTGVEQGDSDATSPENGEGESAKSEMETESERTDTDSDRTDDTDDGTGTESEEASDDEE